MRALERKIKSMEYITREPELRHLKVLYVIYAFLFITDFLMPQYFGIHIGYDITCTRLANMVFVLYALMNPKLLTHFLKTSLGCAMLPALLIYLCVAGYTMIFRVDLNAFFLVFFEMFTLLMLIYGVRYVLGYRKAIKWSITCAYILSVYGLIEFIYGRSIMLEFLATVPTPVRNSYRSGHYRIMGPCGHPLGYGLLLLLFIGLACIDEKKDEINLFKRPALIGLLLINVFLTGSRSTLGIALAEMGLILVCSNYRNIQKSLMMLIGFVVFFALFLLLFQGTGIGRYILMQVTSVLDQVFGTEWSAQFGADIQTLSNSEEYRKYLPRIFTLDWLNPLVGRGVKRGFGAEFDGVYISSVDNYYICQYIKYAYPGLISYLAFMISSFASMIWGIIKYKTPIFKIALIASGCYYLNLWWMDALQTLKYEYIVLAIFYAVLLAKKDETKRRKEESDSAKELEVV